VEMGCLRGCGSDVVAVTGRETEGDKPEPNEESSCAEAKA